MSGSDGGGGGGGDPPPSSCEALRFDALLASPQPAEVATMTVGEVLDVALAVFKGQSVVQVLKKGRVAGGLTGPEANRLRRCIEEAHAYQATVLSINGGQVRVRIEHV